MNWREYFGRDSTLSAEETGRRFARRQGLSLWFGVLPFFGAMVAGWLFIQLEDCAWAFGCFCIFILLLLVYTCLIDRCPRCGTAPSSKVRGTRGALLFRRKCPKCKAPLLPDPRQAQR